MTTPLSVMSVDAFDELVENQPLIGKLLQEINRVMRETSKKGTKSHLLVDFQLDMATPTDSVRAFLVAEMKHGGWFVEFDDDTMYWYPLAANESVNLDDDEDDQVNQYQYDYEQEDADKDEQVDDRCAAKRVKRV